jgi:hypothetical protein
MNEIKRQRISSLTRANDIITAFVKSQYGKVDQYKILKEVNNILDLDCSELGCTKYPEILTFERIQAELSSINEKESHRKRQGVYYTPLDLVEFININLVKLYYSELCETNLGDKSFSFNSKIAKDVLYKRKVFDPTCGTGEFLLSFLKIKFDLLEQYSDRLSVKLVHKIVETIWGNDINNDSIKITQVRLFLYVLQRYGCKFIVGLSDRLKQHFTSFDYVESANNIKEVFHFIVGNPPYVEDSKSTSKPVNKYGNIYANVLENSTNHLSNKGVMGYVIPLSYISTPRMKKIRAIINDRMPEQYLLSYSDRPDCLFSAVHQKLNIILAKSDGRKMHYTSGYKYWYKHERMDLFNNVPIINNPWFVNTDFIPKISNEVERSIFVKVYNPMKDNGILTKLIDNGQAIYLNMRATFWIKAFLGKHEGAEYKAFIFDKNISYFMMCLFNSSLFWWYWVCISDCWHITKKELNSIFIPQQFDAEKVRNLALRLEKCLETTKVYVGTKQTTYEYKHKLCIEIIHEIDDLISDIYGLTISEIEYIKNFNLKYRIGRGN